MMKNFVAAIFVLSCLAYSAIAQFGGGGGGGGVGGGGAGAPFDGLGGGPQFGGGGWGGGPWGKKGPVPFWLWPLIAKQEVQDGRDGEKGKQGWPGFQGDTGPDGPAGTEKGEKGDYGWPGYPGPKGEDSDMDGFPGIPGFPGDPGEPGMDSIGACSTYTIWGGNNMTCEEFGDETLYTGYAANPRHFDTGGGTNYVCLPKYPEFILEPVANSQSLIVGTLFNTEVGEPLEDFNGLAVECTVCASAKSFHLMIPGVSSCPDQPGWYLTYAGYLMSSRDSPSVELTGGEEDHFRAKYMCVLPPPDISGLPEGPESWIEEVFHVYLHCDPNCPLCEEVGYNDEDHPQLTCAVCHYLPPQNL